MFCHDADLLRYEPALAADAAEVAQAGGTFAAQRQVASDQLARLAAPGARPAALRRAATLGALHLIYAALAAAAAPGAEADATVRRELYLRLYRRSLRGIVAAFDDGGDDDPDDATRERGRPRLADAAGD